MPTPLELLITNLQNKTKLLQTRHEYLKKGIESRDATIESLKKELEKEKRLSAELRQTVEYLQVVHSVSPSRENVAQTKAMLSGLVREIDKCIADLSD